MKYPKLTRADHDLRRKLKKKMGAERAFQFVVDKALDRERGGSK